MADRYLEITFRNGRAFAAYLYLPRQLGQRSARTKPFGAGLIVDFAKDDAPIGIEITAPGRVSVTEIDEVLRAIGQPPLEPGEVAPLAAA